MNMKRISNKDLDEVRKRKMLIIDDIRQDYEMIIEHVLRPKDNGNLAKLMEDAGIEFLNSNQELIDIISERKDSKYAALTAELASVMEDYLQELYKASSIDGEKFNTKNRPRGTSTIQALELKLKNYVNIGNEGNLKLLNEIRNKAVHEYAFSLRKAKKEKRVKKILEERNMQEKKKSSEILLQLIIDSEEYVKNTKVKSVIN